MKMLLAANKVLQQKCSVMFFPEGTRSPDGRVGRFNDGAFHLAIKAGVPVLPVAVEGSYACLPKKSWKYGEPSDIYVKVLPPVETAGLTSSDVENLRERVRQLIMRQVAEFRSVSPASIDVLTPETPAQASDRSFTPRYSTGTTSVRTPPARTFPPPSLTASEISRRMWPAPCM